MRTLPTAVQTRLNFTIDDDTDDVVVKIMDKETDEVIKQFPCGRDFLSFVKKCRT